MAYRMTAEEHGFHVDLTGAITFDEIAKANDELIDHSGWDAHTYQIWSFLNASALLDEKRNSRVISRVDTMNLKRQGVQRVKIAFVCTNSKTIEFLYSYIDTVDENLVEARIFAAESEARDWVAA